tara:strand:- start:19 stop:372 length:354 start_codon:yes stop_codon:yes gene_type:complete
MYKLFYIALPILFILSCSKSDAEMAMERGIQLYDWNKLDEAIVEFNKVQYLLSFDEGKSLESVELLAQAHFNLGITYAKMDFYNKAEQEILQALSLIPNPEYREVLKLVRNKIPKSE